MDEFPVVNLLILTQDPANGRRWAEWLSADGGHVWLRREDVPQDSRPDLLLTDAQLPEPIFAGQLAAGNWVGIGVIQVSGTGPADVILPADVSQRELRLACRLLAEVVRLRRQLRSRAVAHRKLLRAALTDPLTDLPNRRAWERTLQRQFSRCEPGRSLCVALLDLDHFKRINDTWGHAAGDALLRAVGDSFRKSLRENDFVARMGGDEFGLLFSVPDRPTAAVVVERVRSQLPSLLTQIGARVVTASAGFCVAEPGSSACSAEELVATADCALREAKRAGRNRTLASS